MQTSGELIRSIAFLTPSLAFFIPRLVTAINEEFEDGFNIKIAWFIELEPLWPKVIMLSFF